jgi:hypothetical protein
MIKLQKQYITEEIFLEAKKYFSKKYIENLDNKTNFIESIVSRYVLSKYIEQIFSIKNYEIPFDFS